MLGDRKAGVVIWLLLHALITAERTVVLGQLVHKHTEFSRNALHQLGFPGMVVVVEGDSGFCRRCSGEWRRLNRSESRRWTACQLLAEDD